MQRYKMDKDRKLPGSDQYNASGFAEHSPAAWMSLVVTVILIWTGKNYSFPSGQG